MFETWQQMKQTKADVRVWTTDTISDLRRLTWFEDLMGIKGYGAMKLFKANKQHWGEVTALLLPPAIETQRSRSEGTDSLEMTCNFGVFGQSGTLRLTEAHPTARAGRVLAFAGYSGEQQQELVKAAMSHLVGLGNRERKFMMLELVAVQDLKICGFIERRLQAEMSIAMMDAAAAQKRVAAAAAATVPAPAAAKTSKARMSKAAAKDAESSAGSDWDDGLETGWEIPVEACQA